MAILPVRDEVNSGPSTEYVTPSQASRITSSAGGSISSSNTALLTITAVGSVLCLVALLVLVYLSISRRRLLARQIAEEASASHPYNKAQGMMTVEDLDWGDEVTRAAIIRKTMASRGSQNQRPESRDSKFSGFDNISLNSHRPGTASSTRTRTDWRGGVEAGDGGGGGGAASSTLQPTTPSRLNHPTLPDLAVVNSSYVPGVRSPLSPLTGQMAPPMSDHPCERIKEMGE